MQDLAEFFGAESPLQSLLPGYQPREGQAWMAEAVADALARDGKLVVEAGTGTGKTFAPPGNHGLAEGPCQLPVPAAAR
jgi:ATP-dependent DNA helicase DinG